MTGFRDRWKVLTLCGLCVSAIAGVTVVVLSVTDYRLGGENEQAVAQSAVRANRLCVDALYTNLPPTAEEALEQLAQDTIESALEQLPNHPYWEPSGLAGRGPLLIDLGCPSPPLPSLGGVEWHNGIPSGSIVPPAEQLSDYGKFIFVMPIENIDSLLGGTSRRRVMQENICSGNVCRSGTTGLYLTPEEIESDLPFVVQTLEQGFGLRE